MTINNKIPSFPSEETRGLWIHLEQQRHEVLLLEGIEGCAMTMEDVIMAKMFSMSEHMTLTSLHRLLACSHPKDGRPSAEVEGTAHLSSVS